MQGERLKLLRKEKHLTQRDFAKRVGIRQNSVALIETGKRNMSSRLIFMICREFGVREEWLRTGEGEMYAPTPNSILGALVVERHLSNNDYVFLERFLELPEKTRQNVYDFLVDFVHRIRLADSPTEEPASEPTLEAQADAFAALAREQFLREKRQESQTSSANESGAE